MRALLEHELMRSIARPGKDVLDVLEKHNETMMAAIGQEDIAEIMRANRDFHFTIFELSPMKQFRREIARLWQLSEGYRHLVVAHAGRGGADRPRAQADHQRPCAGSTRSDSSSCATRTGSAGTRASPCAQSAPALFPHPAVTPAGNLVC